MLTWQVRLLTQMVDLLSRVCLMLVLDRMAKSATIDAMGLVRCLRSNARVSRVVGGHGPLLGGHRLALFVGARLFLS